jgi:hypothetical protein
MDRSDKSRSEPQTRIAAIVLGLFLIPINNYWIMAAATWGSGYPTTFSLFFNAVFFLFFLTLISLAVQRLAPALALNASELLLIYAMLSVASGICGLDMMQVLITFVGGVKWMATPENEWKELFFRHIPDWLVVSDPLTLQGYHEGETTFYIKRHITHWLTPVLVWSGFVSVLAFVMLCLTVIVRKQWIETEKLSYPIIQLPLHLTLDASSFFRNKAMWLGFAIAGGMDLINGLHFLYPVVPGFGGKLYNLAPFFTDAPWNAIGWTPIPIFPYAVGLAFFMPLDLSFSCWFFYLFWKAERIIGSMLGLHNLPKFPYIEEQTSGAYIGLCILAIWVTRHHIRRVFVEILWGNQSPDSEGNSQTSAHENDEPISYRTASLGLLLGFALLIGFSLKSGMTFWAAAIFFALYFILAIGITRMRAELGSPVHDLHRAGAHLMMVNTVGTRPFSVGDLTMFSFYQFFNRAYRGHIMPHQLEGFKLAERSRMNTRRFFWAITLAACVSSVTSFWAVLDTSYQFSVPNIGKVNESFGRLQRWLIAPTSVDYGAFLGMGVGFFFTLFLALLRMSLFWWPLHPAGYAVASNWSINLFWFSIFISWALKWHILRHGGLTLHRRSIPFFMGLILGEFIVGGLWMMRGAFWGVPTYKFLF